MRRARRYPAQGLPGPPAALGHAAAITLVVAAILAAQVGLYKLIRHKHPRWVGMRVGFKDLTAWSFIMASAHGAGLMLVPVLLELSGTMHEMEHQAHEAHEHWGNSVHLLLTNPAPLADVTAVGLHTAAMFTVNGGGSVGRLRQARADDPQAHLVQRGSFVVGGTGWGGCDNAGGLIAARTSRGRYSGKWSANLHFPRKDRT